MTAEIKTSVSEVVAAGVEAGLSVVGITIILQASLPVAQVPEALIPKNLNFYLNFVPPI